MNTLTWEELLAKYGEPIKQHGGIEGTVKDPFWDQPLPHEGIDGTINVQAYIHDLECQVITLDEKAIEYLGTIEKQQKRINHQRRELRRLNRKILDMIRGARMVTNQATDAIDALEDK